MQPTMSGQFAEIVTRRKVPNVSQPDRLTEEELAIKRELYEERAAILEFCANLSRDEAEVEAWKEIYGRKP